ncbi:MAG: SpoIID/LytB domain-containing protein [Bacteroidota bacterium]
MKKSILLLFIFIGSLVHSENLTNVSVRILTTKVITTFIFSPLSGSYMVYADGALLSDCDPTGIYQMSIENDSIRLKTFEKNIGKFRSLKFLSSDVDAVFKIKSVNPQGKVRTCDNNVEVVLSGDRKQFVIINNVDLEKYIAGVVQSEAGKNISLEYYKLQAILCRTFLLSHLIRHEADGFEVCDDVHCQAYIDKATEPNVLKAVLDTRGLVVVDNDLNLITAAFHSNCGGVTCNSQDVWSISTTYLKSVKDTFCLHSPNAHWTRTISLEDWKTYLQLKHKMPMADSLKALVVSSFSQPNGRAIYYTDKDLKLPLKMIRSDFKLKSTYFSIEQDGDSVRFDGRGYGHGVGLCQEGAMRQASIGYSYKHILNYYYRDVHLVDLSALKYFKAE